MVLVSNCLLSRSQQSQRRHYPHGHGEIVDEIIDNDLEENIWNKFINIFKGPVDLKEKGKKKIISYTF